MVAHVKHFFAPPICKDEDDTRMAVLLNFILLTLVASNAIHLIVLSMFTPVPLARLLTSAGVLLVWVGLRWGMQQGWIHLVSLALVSVIWLLITLFAVVMGGVHADPFNLYILCICLAGLLLNDWWGVGIAGISAGARLILLWATSNGRLFPNLFPPMLPSTGLSLWFSQLFIFAVVALLIHFAANNLKIALTRARRSEHALIASEQLLQSRGAQLAQQDVALQQSEVFNQTILNALTAHIAVLDKAGVIIAVNQAWERFAQENGAEPASRTGVGANYLAVCRATDTGAAAADAQAVATGIAAILAGEQTYFTLEYPCHSPTMQRWFVLSAVPLARGGAVVSHVAITGRKLAEIALRQSEERYRQLVEVSPYPIFINRQNRVVYVNAACLQLFGASSAEQLIGKAMFDLIHPNYHALVQQRITDYLNHGQSSPQVEEQFIRLDGASVDVEVVSAPIYDEKELAYLVIARDITHRKQADVALRESESRFRAFFESAAMGAAETDLATGRYLAVNEKFCQMLGYTKAEMLDLTFLDITHPDDQARGDQVRVYQWQGLASEYIMEKRYVRKDGQIIWCKIATNVVHDAKGQIHYTIGIIEDITARKQAEAKNVQLLKDIERQRIRVGALNQRLAETKENERKILASELHDRIGQSLTAFGINLTIMKMQLASESPPVDQIQDRLQDALALTTEMTEQVRDVMADLRPPVLDKFGLLAALQWYATLTTKRTGLPIAVQGEEPTPRLAEQTELLLFRVTQEALLNVIKHAEATQATITLLAEAGLVRLTIADNGHGFEPTQLAEVGIPQGWGLLTIRERLEAIHGVYQLASNPGIGTTLIIEVKQ